MAVVGIVCKSGGVGIKVSRGVLFRQVQLSRGVKTSQTELHNYI